MAKAPPPAPRATPLAERIREARKALDISQEELAARLDVDKTTISHWELGIAAPRRHRLDEVAAELRIPVKEFRLLYLTSDEAA